jgi:hypothetical protein
LEKEREITDQNSGQTKVNQSNSQATDLKLSKGQAKNSFYFQFMESISRSIHHLKQTTCIWNAKKTKWNSLKIAVIPKWFHKKKISFYVLSFSYSEQGMNPAPLKALQLQLHIVQITPQNAWKIMENPRHKLRFKQWEEGNFLGASFAPWKNRICNPNLFHSINNSQGCRMLENHHVALQNHNIQRMYCKNHEQILPVLKSFNSLFPLPCSLFCILKWHHLFWLNIT